MDYLKAVEGRIGRDGYGASPRTLQDYRGRLAYLLESDRYVYNVLQATNIFFRTLDITSCVLLRKWQPLTGSITERLISRRPPSRRFGCDRSHLRNFLSHKRRSHSFSMYKCFMNSTESE